MQITHSRIITLGIGIITLSLVVVFLREDTQPPQEVSGPDDSKKTTIQDLVTPVAQAIAFVEKVTTMVTPTVTMVTTTVSPSLSPLSPSLSPVSPSVQPSITARIASPTPVYSSVVSATPTATPTPSQITPTPTPEPAQEAKVVINEVGWMGTDGSSSDEWIELYNASPVSVDLSGWLLLSNTDDSPHISLVGTMAPYSYYLIERTDDSTIADILADLVSSFGQGGLNNSGEVLVLKNSQGAVVDETSSGGWPAGTATPRVSMERVQANQPGTIPENWASNDGITTTGQAGNGAAIRGTPKYKNSTTR